MTDLSYAKRELVLDLVECLKMESTNDVSGLTSFVPYTQHRAIAISRADSNWRNHKVRSKKYIGRLGELFDRFSAYHSTLYLKV